MINKPSAGQSEWRRTTIWSDLRCVVFGTKERDSVDITALSATKQKQVLDCLAMLNAEVNFESGVVADNKSELQSILDEKKLALEEVE